MAVPDGRARADGRARGQTLFAVYTSPESGYIEVMARPLRIEYPNAIYHVMARGNGRQAIIHADDDYGPMVA